MNRFEKIISESQPTGEILPDGGIRYEDDFYISYLDKNGRFHRIDGPAFVNKTNSHKSWFLNGKRHRTDGPAVINSELGREEYWVNGREFTKREFYKHFGES